MEGKVLKSWSGYFDERLETFLDESFTIRPITCIMKVNDVRFYFVDLKKEYKHFKFENG